MYVCMYVCMLCMYVSFPATDLTWNVFCTYRLTSTCIWFAVLTRFVVHLTRKTERWRLKQSGYIRPHNSNAGAKADGHSHETSGNWGMIQTVTHCSPANTHLMLDSRISERFHALPPHGGNLTHFCCMLINNNIFNATTVSKTWPDLV